MPPVVEELFQKPLLPIIERSVFSLCLSTEKRRRQTAVGQPVSARRGNRELPCG